MRKLNSNNFWKVLFVSSLCVAIIGLYNLNNLNYVNISGDGIPNLPQKEPPIEYPWNQAIQYMIIVAVSVSMAIFSLYKVFH